MTSSEAELAASIEPQVHKSPSPSLEKPGWGMGSAEAELNNASFVSSVRLVGARMVMVSVSGSKWISHRSNTRLFSLISWEWPDELFLYQDNNPKASNEQNSSNERDKRTGKSA